MPPKKRSKKDDSDDNDVDNKSSAATTPKMNKADTDYRSIDFGSDAKTKSGKKWNFKISSWYYFRSSNLKTIMQGYKCNNKPLGVIVAF